MGKFARVLQVKRQEAQLMREIKERFFFIEEQYQKAFEWSILQNPNTWDIDNVEKMEIH